MKTFFPETGNEAEWNAAYYRLEDYLRAHWVINKVHQSQLILAILQRAARRHAGNPEASPISLTMEEAWQEIDSWFQNVLQHPDLPAERASAMGRVGLLLTDATVRWPTLFLSETPPLEFLETLRQTTLQAGPDLVVSSMVPRIDDEDLAPNRLEETWEKISAAAVYLLAGLAGFISIGLFLVFHH